MNFDSEHAMQDHHAFRISDFRCFAVVRCHGNNTFFRFYPNIQLTCMFSISAGQHANMLKVYNSIKPFNMLSQARNENVIYNMLLNVIGL